MKNNSLYIRFLIFIFPITFILPFLEVNFFQSLLDIRLNESYLPAIIFMMLPFIVLYGLGTFLCSKNLFKRNKCFIFFFIYVLYFVLNSLFTINFYPYFDSNTLIFQCLYFIIPVIYSLILFKFFYVRIDDKDSIIRRCIILFCCYLFICIIINIKNYGFEIGDESRLISPGGGATILGYTISIVMAIIYCKRPFNNRIIELVISSFCFIATILSGSRGGIWPSAVVLLMIIFINKKRFNFLGIAFILLFFILLNPISLLEDFFPRIFNSDSENRILTFENTFSCFKNFNMQEKIFGKGIGNFFPYQRWKLLQYAKGWESNIFTYAGNTMLVEPHNTYIYIFLEQGIIGVLLYFLFLLSILIYIIKSNHRFGKLLFFVIFVFLGVVEGTIFIQPGIAGIWLFLLFVSFTDYNYEKKVE